MAKFTVELGTLAKNGFNVFNFPYTFYDESKKAEFEQMFIRHFYFREIGVETPAKFQHYLRVKCDETLPYYNELFRTALIEYDRTNNYTMEEVLEKSREAEGTAEQTGTNTDTSHTDKVIERKSDTTTKGNHDKNSESTTDDRKVESNTPSALLTMEDIKGNIYASNAEIIDGKNNVHDVSVIDDTFNEATKETMDSNIENVGEMQTKSEAIHKEVEKSNLKTFGNTGFMTVSEMLQKHIKLQKTLTSIYADFFNECDDLFMQIYMVEESGWLLRE